MVEEPEASQPGFEDGGAGGPGAPTPLTALEVSQWYSDFDVPGLQDISNRALQV
jgi:hypothetical protein